MKYALPLNPPQGNWTIPQQIFTLIVFPILASIKNQAA